MTSKVMCYSIAAFMLVMTVIAAITLPPSTVSGFALGFGCGAWTINGLRD